MAPCPHLLANLICDFVVTGIYDTIRFLPFPLDG